MGQIKDAAAAGSPILPIFPIFAIGRMQAFQIGVGFAILRARPVEILAVYWRLGFFRCRCWRT